MNKIQHFQKYKLAYEIAFIVSYFFIHSTINATSVIMEAQRHAFELPFGLWEPFSWEYSRAIETLILLPVISWLLTKYPINWHSIKISLLVYWGASIIYCLLHVAMMVGLREIMY